ncbi:hypothetical protein ONZ45_g15780 [Pleurotus djamor]|nr:hypothetical protein ONZ45_g15780 [Pleurotus djamor]
MLSYLASLLLCQAESPADYPLDASLCDICATINFRHILHHNIARDEAINLGFLLDILAKADICAFCRLVTTVFNETWFQAQPPSEFNLAGITCAVYAAGHSYTNKDEPATGEPCYGFAIQPSTRPTEIGTMLSASGSSMLLLIRVLEDSINGFNVPEEYRGRRLTSVFDMGQVKTWVQICLDGHQKVCQGSWWLDRGAVPSAVRVIDVETMSLVPAPKSPRYIALSYVWGKVVSSYQTMKDNVGARMKPGGIDASILPATIVDAILVCKQLGERYLWVDALCIIQDNWDDKAAQIGVMHQIYGCSYLTIFAVGGSDARSGLPGLRQNSRIDQSNRIEVVQGLNLQVPLPNLLNVLQRSVWGRRGWTYQEGILPCRRLYFTQHQVYFECLKEVWCEDTVSGDPRRPHSSSVYRHSGLGSLTYLNPPKQSWQMTSYTNGYMILVNKYGHREFTSETDAVDGFSAITTALANAFSLGPHGFRYGMLLKQVEVALLWVPLDNVRHVRRDIPQNSPWPSWAWVGWRGAVEYVTKCITGESLPSVTETIVRHWYLYEGRRLVDVESLFNGGIALDQTLPRYSAPKAPVQLGESVVLPEGTLVFRTTSAVFKVGEHDPARSSEATDAFNGAFHLHVTDGGPTVGRIYLPYASDSSSAMILPSVREVDLVVIAAASGDDTMCSSDDEYALKCLHLHVMAVRKVHREGFHDVVERLGIGLVSEGAWIRSDAEERVVFLA